MRIVVGVQHVLVLRLAPVSVHQVVVDGKLVILIVFAVVFFRLRASSVVSNLVYPYFDRIIDESVRLLPSPGWASSLLASCMQLLWLHVDESLQLKAI